MSKRKIYTLVVPTITFFLGIIFQLLLQQWITFKDVISFAMILIVVSLAFIFTAALTILESIEKRFNTVDVKLDDMAARTGLRVEYIEDGSDGASYHRSAELIEDAKVSIIYVSPWEPFKEYISGPSNLRNARQAYYDAIKRQVDRHKTDEKPFHCRIVQVPKEYEDKPLPFTVDVVFFEYLNFVAEAQETHPRSCQLRKATALINAHFTLIDSRYIIMPILTHYKNERQIRHGSLFFDDGQGDLVKSLNSIYLILNTQSQPITTNELKALKAME